MHDLRRQALESGKTVSRKARSRQASRATSRATSPAAPMSRQSSKNGTPADSDDGFSDNSSLGLVSGNVSSDEELPVTAPEQKLSEIIDNLLDKNTKRQNTQLRIQNLQLYINSKIAFRLDEQKDIRETQLVATFLKMVKAERSEEEALLSLHALAIVCVSSTAFASGMAAGVYDEVSDTLKRFISNTESLSGKAAAIHALGTFTFYGGVSDDEVKDVMAYFLEIVSSDGAFIEAHDAPLPVHAAIQEYGFLLTRFDEFEEDSNDAVEAFLDQLTSTDPDIQIAAAESIALLYEVSYSPMGEDDEEPKHEDPDWQMKKDGNGDLVKRYNAYRRTDEVESQLETLARATFHGLTQKKKRALHSNMSDVLDSIRNPAHGPRYQNALDMDHRVIGSTMKVRIGSRSRRAVIIYIDTWWKLLRYQHLVRVLKGGFNQHYLDNQLVSESLPSEAMFDEDGDAIQAKHYGRSARLEVPGMDPYAADPWVQ